MAVLQSNTIEGLDDEGIADPFADRRILVLLASYRDPELPRTISNALSQAAYPEHLRFSICHQFDDDTVDDLSEWHDDPRFSIDAIPHEHSSGCCWARARTYERHDDEPYILQVDAHTRFAARWDQRFIDMLESIDSDKAILTCYPPSYTVNDSGEDNYQLDGHIHRLKLARLNHDLTTRQSTEPVDDDSRPGPSPLLAAGQIFTRGSFCTEIPYDPEIYFAGEEISLAVRAFTNGYDLYFPNQNLVWHRYSHGVPLHWEDKPDEQGDLHATAVERLRILLSERGRELGQFGLGDKRTLEDFERMAEIDFTLTPDAGWSAEGELELETSDIDFSRRYRAWVFALFSASGKELQRDDITDGDVLSGAKKTVELRALDLDDKPTSYLIWPVHDDGTFGDRRTHELDDRLLTAPPDVDVDTAPERAEAPDTATDRANAPTESEEQSTKGGFTVTIDRSVIEPRDDYTAFVLAFLDSRGIELSRVDLVRPDVLDLSIGEVTLHDVECPAAVAYAVIPTRRDGKTGTVRVQPLERDHA